TEIQRLTTELSRKDDEVAKLRATTAKYKGTEDPASVLALKVEIANLREQLTQMSKVKSSTRGETPPPQSQRQEGGFLTAAASSKLKPPQKRRVRRHSSAESWGPQELSKSKPKTSVDLMMAEAKKPGLRPASISYSQVS